MSTPYFSLGAYAAAVHAAIAAGQLELVLVDVALKAETVKNDPLATCRAFGSPVLDGLCAAIGGQPPEPPPLRMADVEPMQSFLYEKSFLMPAGVPGG